jgi:hypothetical protein
MELEKYLEVNPLRKGAGNEAHINYTKVSKWGCNAFAPARWWADRADRAELISSSWTTNNPLRLS